MTMAPVRVEGIGKSYRIGKGHKSPYEADLSSSTIARSLRFLQSPWLARFFGSESHDENHLVWALKDVSFTVNHGEVIGIIGPNGAGKSTLLKILTRVTVPTEGYADIHGRVGSLLEVGTGFHPELTGRDNIFLSGAILGMRTKEIWRKFDEIVAFAEVEKFVDTPVKHYSSGMYVRLAFAVAAHLDPDILIVDEVLAVGDIRFQRKCLGKIEEAAKKTGRTVLFVSHNMGSILHLCDRALVLDSGRVVEYADARTAVNTYLLKMNPEVHTPSGVFVRSRSNGEMPLIQRVELSGQDKVARSMFEYGESMRIEVRTNRVPADKFGVELRIKNSQHHLIGYVSSWIGQTGANSRFAPGDTVVLNIPALPFVQDTYYIDVICRLPNVYHVDNWWDAVSFTVTACRPGESPVSIQARDQLGSLVLDASVSREDSC
jgi:ABC-type polysaccharide/polyol phosphate transport system ATPase subunit